MGARFDWNNAILVLEALPGILILDLALDEALPGVHLTILLLFLDLSCIYGGSLLVSKLRVNASHDFTFKATIT